MNGEGPAIVQKMTSLPYEHFPKQTRLQNTPLINNKTEGTPSIPTSHTHTGTNKAIMEFPDPCP